jgi:hypothetical protein
MKAWHNLMIRQCKATRTSTRSLRRIYAQKCGLHLQHCPVEYAISGLMEIIKEYNVVKDYSQFIFDVHSHQQGYWEDNCLDFLDAYLAEAVSKIRLTEIKIFPGYSRPARFRNRKDFD